MPGGQGGHGPQVSKLSDFWKSLMLCPKIFGLLLLAKSEVSTFIEKSLNLPPSTAPLGVSKVKN